MFKSLIYTNVYIIPAPIVPITDSTSFNIKKPEQTKSFQFNPAPTPTAKTPDFAQQPKPTSNPPLSFGFTQQKPLSTPATSEPSKSFSFGNVKSSFTDVAAPKVAEKQKTDEIVKEKLKEKVLQNIENKENSTKPFATNSPFSAQNLSVSSNQSSFQPKTLDPEPKSFSFAGSGNSVFAGLPSSITITPIKTVEQKPISTPVSSGFNLSFGGSGNDEPTKPSIFSSASATTFTPTEIKKNLSEPPVTSSSFSFGNVLKDVSSAVPVNSSLSFGEKKSDIKTDFSFENVLKDSVPKNVSFNKTEIPKTVSVNIVTTATPPATSTPS